MQVVILGGSGFIGTALARLLAARGDEVIIPTRGYAHPLKEPAIAYAPWDGRSVEDLARLADGSTAIVNLLGENIASGRWTSQKKASILQSRLQAGHALTQACVLMESKPSVIIQASAVGYYGTWTCLDCAPLCPESAPPGLGFLASTAVEWEYSTQKTEAMGIRRCVIRTAPVLGSSGGMLTKILPLFRLFLGGPIGSGHQPFPWIHLDDEVSAIAHLLQNSQSVGVYNLVSPENISMYDFANALGQALHRPAWLKVPAFATRLVFGQMAEETILAGQRAVPEHLLQEGFAFAEPDITIALQHIVNNLE